MKGMRAVLKTVTVLLLICILFAAGVRAYVVFSTDKAVLPAGEEETLAERQDDPYEAIIVLGAGVNPDGSLSPMLRYRMEKVLEVWKTGAAKSIFVSGDHRIGEYDEVDHMVEYLIVNGVPEEAIWFDYNGFSTYESMYRVAEVYNIRHAIVITQQYHLYRALYIGKSYGMEAVGVAAENWRMSSGTVMRTLREWPACIKDLWNCIVKKEIRT